jgi:hypothetical protein
MGTKVVTLQPRVVRGIMNNKDFRKNVTESFDELQRLMGYYQDEVEQLTLLIKRKERGEDYNLFLRGQRKMAIDIAEELGYVVERFRGLKDDMEAK